MDAPARTNAEPRGELPGPQRYKVQFTATEEYVQLVDEAKALLSHAAPRVTLEDVQLRAMRAFVEALRRRKYGAAVPAGDAARRAPSLPTAEGASTGAAGQYSSSASFANESAMALEPRRRGRQMVPGSATSAPGSATSAPGSETSPNPRWRGRHIPAAVRGAVAARDRHCCTYVDASGRRCAETRLLEFHHVVPFAVSPAHEASNLTLRCRAHNALAAEQDFGRDVIRATRSASRHDGADEQVR
jgi:hypothetical protein